jgi:hypothetical protein
MGTRVRKGDPVFFWTTQATAPRVSVQFSHKSGRSVSGSERARRGRRFPALLWRKRTLLGVRELKKACQKSGLEQRRRARPRPMTDDTSTAPTSELDDPRAVQFLESIRNVLGLILFELTAIGDALGVDRERYG